MQRRIGSRIAALRRDADERHRAGHFLQHIGEILRPHHWREHLLPALLTTQIRRDPLHQRGRARFVHRHRIAEFDDRFAGRAVRRGDILDDADERLLHLLARLFR